MVERRRVGTNGSLYARERRVVCGFKTSVYAGCLVVMVTIANVSLFFVGAGCGQLLKSTIANMLGLKNFPHGTNFIKS